MRNLAIVAGLAALVAVVVIGLSQAGSQGGEPKTTATPTGAAAQAALRGSPPALAALHRQAGQLLPGGKPAFDARRRALAGHPLVVNGWASWCGPCRFEFPFFQAQATRLGRKVAFLGLDVTDNADDAKRFLRQFPQPYPSYADPRGTTMQSLAPTTGLPNTVFFDARGRKTFVHQGGYRSQQQLATDIRRYALGGGA
jgi:cytochrome c biogenesis protein CcmG, thiol:disulfide interchange protein DsbE